eukprot:352735-Chlamydomonas_euryale.AAC.8
MSIRLSELRCGSTHGNEQAAWPLPVTAVPQHRGADPGEVDSAIPASGWAPPSLPTESVQACPGLCVCSCLLQQAAVCGAVCGGFRDVEGAFRQRERLRYRECPFLTRTNAGCPSPLLGMVHRACGAARSRMGTAMRGSAALARSAGCPLRSARGGRGGRW